MAGIFEELRARIWPVVRDVATRIEHVGSITAPWLAAKLIVDVSLVAPAESDVPAAIQRHSTLVYDQGDLGVAGRARTPNTPFVGSTRDGSSLDGAPYRANAAPPSFSHVCSAKSSSSNI